MGLTVKDWQIHQWGVASVFVKLKWPLRRLNLSYLVIFEFGILYIIISSILFKVTTETGSRGVLFARNTFLDEKSISALCF